jgi:hypothetical protein
MLFNALKFTKYDDNKQQTWCLDTALLEVKGYKTRPYYGCGWDYFMIP